MADTGDRPSSSALGFGSLLALGINGIVGVGIFFAPSGIAARVPGLSGLWVYAATGLLLLPISHAYATLGGRFHEDGGPYVWARAAFGPMVGYAVGWVAWASALFSTAAVLVAFGAHAAPLFGVESALGRQVFVVGLVVGLSSVVATGLRPSAITWSSLTVLKLVPLVLLVGLGLFWFGAAPGAGTGSATSVAPGLDDLGRAALIVVFASQGFEVVPVVAGHTRASSVAVPLATVVALLSAVALYVLLHFVCVRALPDLAHSSAPLVDAARVYGGGWASGLVALGTNVSALGIAFGMFAITPRYLAALGSPEAMGAWLGREDARGVPQRALVVTAGAVVAVVLVGKLDELFVLSSVAVVSQYAVTVLSLVQLARRRERGLGPRNLVTAPFALGAVALIGFGAKWQELAVAGGFLVVGFVVLVVRRGLRPAGVR